MAQSLALDEFFGDEMQGAGFALYPADFVDSNNVRMIERGRGFRLLLESAHAVAIRCEFRRQQFERDMASERGILSQEDLTHSARPQARENPVAPELPPEEGISLFNERIGDGGRFEKASRLLVGGEHPFDFEPQDVIGAAGLREEIGSIFAGLCQRLVKKPIDLMVSF